ncbi:S1C family serine protease [Microbacterium sp. AK031]|uniref:S1C family serine protease n=1 Tax=Microbacterium sp. AK031 TaxID=2723076 RepID=UPI002168942E|nr:trypsin-like peptidase domain-containing protein [Microbacterium sp. AK031]MCS3842071.1 putative serine protease PepD [Microbacterium sp. AK031]
MNEDKNINESASSEQPAPQEPVGSVAGHDMPASFASHQAPTPQEAPTPSSPQEASRRHPSPQGAAFGIPVPTYPVHHADQNRTDQPTTPLFGERAARTAGDSGDTGTPAQAKTKEKKPFGAGKVAALIVAASLVGGAAGLGGSYLGSNLWAQPNGTTATGTDTITVNNPGSVNETTAIATTVLPSVVTIEVAAQNGSGSGSGVVISKDGYVLTNTHVVTLGGAAADPAIRVTGSDGHIYDATIVGTDPIYDLAVIKLEGAEDLTPIDFADSSALNVGSTAVAVGAPLGLSNSVTTGIVSALNRSIQIASAALPDSAEQDQENGDESEQEGGPFQFDLPGAETQGATESISIAVIQTDAAINPGNSGGALVDSEGKLIGINVAIATAGSAEESGSIGVGFAIPSNVAKRISEEIIEDGVATHGLLGASVSNASSVEGAEVAGAYIADAPVSGGAAEAAGLREGDIVTSFNGAPIGSASDLTAQVRAAAAGSDATLTYVRDGKSYDIGVTLGELAL